MFKNNIVRYTKVRAGFGGNGSNATSMIRKAPQFSGGDGGYGGKIIFKASQSIFLPRVQDVYKAEHGANGRRGNKNGKSGEDVIIPLSRYSCIEIMTVTDIYEKFYYIHDDRQFTIRGARGGGGSFITKGNTKCGNRTTFYELKITTILKNITFIAFDSMWNTFMAFCNKYTKGINCKNYSIYTYKNHTIIITNLIDDELKDVIKNNGCEHFFVKKDAITFQDQKIIYKDFDDFCDLIHSLLAGL